MSTAEPELGLGFVSEINQRTISIFFEGSNLIRTYGKDIAPLKRVQFNIGDKVLTKDGKQVQVERIEDVDGITVYCGQDQIVPETQLSVEISFSKPEERLLNGHTDPPPVYELRQEALTIQQRLMQSSARGFTGPRVALLPHQIYVATEVGRRALPRVLLADEVGLGKTIEAGLILHHLLITGKAERVLIAAPNSLTHQWFVEMYRRYNLSFGVLTKKSDFPEDENPFDEKQLHIISAELLTGHAPAQLAALESSWDLLIVDEAHHLKWSPDNVSPGFQTIQHLSEKAAGLLLLTATPEQLGPEGHFARLQLLDPSRFTSYKEFQKESSQYKKIAAEAHELLEQKKGSTKAKIKQVRELIDQHGTGRVMFRNSRRSISSTSVTFPKRQAYPYPLASNGKDNANDPKFTWLKTFLMDHRDQKVLFICKHKDLVIEIQEKLRTFPSIKTTLFHSHLSLMARDRNAAYFAEADGAQVLLCSEIGSEGRNFQFSHNLILYDLPKDPELLEQRIGRLDRIGQAENIHIHIPYIEGSAEEARFRWYHEGFNAFEQCPRGAEQLSTLLGEDMERISEAYETDPSNSQLLTDLLTKTKKEYKKIQTLLEKGRDRLLELNSFDQEKATEAINVIQSEESKAELKSFMSNVFRLMGVQEEELDSTSSFIEPGHSMYSSEFPGLPADGMRITYDRDTALHQQETTFLSWDHPMVIGVLDMMLGNEYGNVSVAAWKKTPQTAYPVIEACFILTFVAPAKLYASEFFPPTVFRVALDGKGDDVSSNWPSEKLRSSTESAKKSFVQQISKTPRGLLQKLLEKAKQVATPQAEHIRQTYESNLKGISNAEIRRLEQLREKNGLVRKEEIQYFGSRMSQLLEVSKKAELRLDSFRLIIKNR